ncbi:MAG: outer membrane lipoprotein carrier protein LolA [Terracidiphilus sp.]
MKLRNSAYILMMLVIFSLVLTAQSPIQTAPQPDDLLMRVWSGVQGAQAKFTTACGSVVETRTSKMMVKPMVLRGKFCADGMTRFWLEYAAPNELRIRFNGDYLNVTAGDGQTEVLEIGSGVRRAQSAFSRESSIVGLKKNFIITATETAREYELKFVPNSEVFRRRMNYLIVKLNKSNFLPRSLEVDGKSGVNSVFAIEMTSLNAKLPAESFEVTKPK